jgi:uncharacterized membrane protein YbhN (UPF0104 family)
VRCAVRWLSLGLTALAGLALVWLLLHADWQPVRAALSAARWELVALALVLHLASELVKSVRWLVLLGLPRQALPEVIGLVLGSRLLNALSPLRAGDVWRTAYAVGAQGRAAVSSGGALLVEKLLDGGGLGLVALLVFGGEAAGWPSLVGLLAGALAAAYLARHIPVQRLAPWLRRGLAELAHLRRRRIQGEMALLTAASLALGLGVNLATLAALGLPADILHGALMLLAGYAVAAVPGPPASLGVFEVAVALPLTARGLDPGLALAAAILVHLVLLMAIALGAALALGLGLWRPDAHSRSDASGPTT